MPDEDTIRATVDAYLRAFTEGDRAGYVGLFAEDATVEDPVGSPVHRGHDEIGAFWDASRTMADAIELRPVFVTVTGGEAAFHMEVRPTIGGQVFVLDAIDHMTFAEDGRICTMRAFFDPATMRPAGD